MGKLVFGERTRLISKTLFACLAWCASYAEPTTLPIKFSHGRAIVSARVNRSEPLTFLLDSACTITTLHPSLLQQLALQQSGHVTINGIAGEERAPTYKGVMFDFAGLTYAPYRVAIVPSEAGQKRRTDGVLGYGFLRQFVVELNPATQQIRLFSPTNYTYSGKGEIVPFRFKAEIPVVKASIVISNQPPVEGEFEIDTGCDSGLCLGSTFVGRNKLLETVKTHSDEKFGIGGSVETESGVIPVFRLGNLEVLKAQTDFFTKGSPVDEPLAGHIGMGVLHRYKLIFDYSRNRLILE
ncbi:MAG: hypothetical protein JWM99_2488 [Verrucomicrobiales bacterium]|nr:hypothetical protein [Verrucomicrobiales bacterium]